MRKINLANEKGRNAEIGFKSFTQTKDVVSVDKNNKSVSSKKIIKATIKSGYPAISAANDSDPAKIAQALIDGNPEVDIELVGKFIGSTSRVFIDENINLVYSITKTEKVFNTKGEMTAEREPRHLPANIISDIPIKWSGKLFKKAAVYNKFVFVRKYQLQHDSGLTYDFLYDMAQKLHESESLMLMGSGNGTGPIVFQDGGKPFRAFLEGRIQGDQYLLLLHISNLELKPLPTDD